MNEILLENGTYIKNYGFINLPEYSEIDHLVNKSLKEEEFDKFEKDLKNLTREQKQIFNTIMNMVANDKKDDAN